MVIRWNDHLQSSKGGGKSHPTLWVRKDGNWRQFEGKALEGFAIDEIRPLRFERGQAVAEYLFSVEDGVDVVSINRPPYGGWGLTWGDLSNGAHVLCGSLSEKAAIASLAEHWETAVDRPVVLMTPEGRVETHMRFIDQVSLITGKIELSELGRAIAGAKRIQAEAIAAVRHKPSIWLCNAFSLQMIAQMVERKDACIAKICSIKKPKDLTQYRSAIGHPDLANLLGVDFNRQEINLSIGDQIVVAQYRGPRLPEGTTTLPSTAVIDWYLVTIGESDG